MDSPFKCIWDLRNLFKVAARKDVRKGSDEEGERFDKSMVL
jgi:hypothetical protein